MFTFTFHDLLAKNLQERPDRVAMICGREEATYGDLAQRAEALAAWLVEAGVRKGDRVGIHLRKSIGETVATFAVARIGAVFVNVNYQWTPRQLAYILADCDIRVLITDRRKANLLAKGQEEALAGLRHVLVSGPPPDHEKMTSWDLVPPDAHVRLRGPIDSDLAALLYTSGSTGSPKGVMLTHLNIIEGARSVACYLRNTSDDRVLGLLPMSFDYGMSQVTTMFLVGGSVVLQPVAFAAEIVKTVAEHHVTGFAAVPPAWVQVVRYLRETGQTLPGLRYVTNSGGKIPPAVLESMPTVLPGAKIYLMYGLTEAFRSTYLPPEQFARKMGAIGQAIPNADIYVVDSEKGLRGPGEQGELIHRGSLVSRGYWGSPEVTNEKIKACPHLRHLIGDEKVLYSGDLVRIDEDGILWFVGRADSMIKCSGYRISPTEVEDIVYQSGLVTDVVAFGVESDELGQVVHVAASWANPSAGRDDELLRHCQQNMPSYMIPQRIHARDGAMPRTASGKIDRPRVVQACRDGA